jgi:mono/diheme cytochrome c family protein
MNSNSLRAILAGVVIALMLAAAFWLARRAPAPEPAEVAAPQKTAAKPETRGPVADPDQRSLRIYEFRKAADSGPNRGQEIFYYKCWFCHNEFAQGAPSLKGVYQRAKLLSGRPATDDGIKDEIRNGGPGMAAYKFTLSDADLDDLASYLREKCCWDSNSPPANPRYRFGDR